MTAKYCDIFWSFFKVGTFTIGGGYAMIPLMQREIVERHRWIGEEEFMDQVALSQAMPGVFAVNMATMTGYRLRGVRGAVVAIVGNVLMPIVFILVLAMFFRAFREVPAVERIFMGLRPAVVALIAAPVFTMAKSAKVAWSNVWIPVVSALLIWLFGVSPIVVVLGAALLGYFYSKLRIGN
ncbi:MAG: chromate transporter [Bacteroidales bacterium]|nr:chromate transporter [Bacteroidales bacterium]